MKLRFKVPVAVLAAISLLPVGAFGLTTALSYAGAGLVNWPIAGLFVGGGVAGVERIDELMNGYHCGVFSLRSAVTQRATRHRRHDGENEFFHRRFSFAGEIVSRETHLGNKPFSTTALPKVTLASSQMAGVT